LLRVGLVTVNTTIKVFKGAPLVETSTWYKGILMLALMTPGGFLSATATMAIPAQSLAIPPDDGITYATVNLDETMKVFAKYGVRFLAPDEIAGELPAFPLCTEN
jgi:hypothetical protein